MICLGCFFVSFVEIVGVVVFILLENFKLLEYCICYWICCEFRGRNFVNVLFVLCRWVVNLDILDVGYE